MQKKMIEDPVLMNTTGNFKKEVSLNFSNAWPTENQAIYDKFEFLKTTPGQTSVNQYSQMDLAKFYLQLEKDVDFHIDQAILKTLKKANRDLLLQLRNEESLEEKFLKLKQINDKFIASKFEIKIYQLKLFLEKRIKQQLKQISDSRNAVVFDRPLCTIKNKDISIGAIAIGLDHNQQLVLKDYFAKENNWYKLWDNLTIENLLTLSENLDRYLDGNSFLITDAVDDIELIRQLP